MHLALAVGNHRLHLQFKRLLGATWRLIDVAGGRQFLARHARFQIRLPTDSLERCSKSCSMSRKNTRSKITSLILRTGTVQQTRQAAVELRHLLPRRCVLDHRSAADKDLDGQRRGDDHHFAITDPVALCTTLAFPPWCQQRCHYYLRNVNLTGPREMTHNQTVFAPLPVHSEHPQIPRYRLVWFQCCCTSTCRAKVGQDDPSGRSIARQTTGRQIVGSEVVTVGFGECLIRGQNSYHVESLTAVGAKGCRRSLWLRPSRLRLLWILVWCLAPSTRQTGRERATF